jgi:NADH-quinone oxidoreductase subunit N
MWPEFLLGIVGAFLILLGTSSKRASRRAAPIIALLTLIAIFAIEWGLSPVASLYSGAGDTVRLFNFTWYIKLITSGVGILLVLVAWPSNDDATGNAALNFGHDAGEFYGLMLLSIAGVFVVAGANDIMLLFLGIELASIPTYVMVSISRPLAVAQEAGVKYFFLGALAAALMLLGFTYLYGTTGVTSLSGIAAAFSQSLKGAAGGLDTWQMLAVVLLIGGFAFKMAAVPLHFYAGDVYQGAATPVTAFLAFVPKISGFVALIKILFVAGGGAFFLPHTLAKLLWVVAIFTMCVGNVVALWQVNVKRMLAYSSIAHSGYMLVGITALVMTQSAEVQDMALRGVLFYLAAYGIMNTGAFAVLTLLPSRKGGAATSAETFEDLAGQGRHHLALGLAMVIVCFSLTGLPFTIGFFGKVYLIKPALAAANFDPSVQTMMIWLVILLVLNAAISAGYYLRIIASMFLRPEPAGSTLVPGQRHRSAPIAACALLSAAGTLWFGIVLPATNGLTNRTQAAAHMDPAALSITAQPEATVMAR